MLLTLKRSLTIVLALLLAAALSACQRGASDAPADGGAQAEAPLAAPQDAGSRPENVPTPLPPVGEVADLNVTATPPPGPARPARVQIPSAGVDVPVLIVAVDQEGYLPTPDEHAGYWALSAPLDGDGNTVIVGHNRTSPVEVFRNLPRVEVGDEIILIDQFNAEYRYEVTEVELFQVEGNPEEAQRTLDYIDPELSKRVTLITCQPEGECTQRLIVVAVPADE
ncbi:MAG TPA: sortase [Aggregatilineales bacterium]|nr:sortase [Chloroflexota bacterium]HOA24575.1 sortase [Aggregatilineales bacterium]HPV05755.1 sortase [Aggregatilineales bacterium]HQA70021.1 sortase [Aggregatilineales bacterium]